MPVYTIDLAIRSACHDYADLIAALWGAGARPVVGKRWLIELGGDGRAIAAALLRHCAPGDALFMIELSRGPEGHPAVALTPSASAAAPRPAPR